MQPQRQSLTGSTATRWKVDSSGDLRSPLVLNLASESCCMQPAAHVSCCGNQSTRVIASIPMRQPVTIRNQTHSRETSEGVTRESNAQYIRIFHSSTHPTPTEHDKKSLHAERADHTQAKSLFPKLRRKQGHIYLCEDLILKPRDWTSQHSGSNAPPTT